VVVYVKTINLLVSISLKPNVVKSFLRLYWIISKTFSNLHCSVLHRASKRQSYYGNLFAVRTGDQILYENFVDYLGFGTLPSYGYELRTVLKMFILYFLNNAVKNQPIRMIFGKQNPEEILQKWLYS